MFKTYMHGGEQIAMVIRNNYRNDGIKFFTGNNSPQQIAYMSHPASTVVKAHVHNVIKREIYLTQEVLIIKKGTVRLDLYTQEREYLESTILNEGDIVFLAYGGHGLKCINDVEMIEVKQGPYLGENDKVRFTGIDDKRVIMNE